MNDPNKLCTYSGAIQLTLNRLSNKLNTHWSNAETAIESILQKKLFSKIFAKFTRNHVLESLFNKVAGLTPRNFIKKRPQHKYFLVNFAKFLKTPIL